jgi:hypothetical protein
MYIGALKVFCLRAGIKVLILSVRAMIGIGDIASVHRPDVIVLAGTQIDETTLARWTSAIERSIGPRPLALYRHARLGTYATVLPPAPGDAQVRLLELVDANTTSTSRRLAS